MKRNIWAFIIISLCVVLLSSENSYAKELYNRDEDIKKLEINIDKYVEKYKEGLVSCQIAVFNGDRISLKKTYGYKNIENKVLADFDTVYDWGSSSKLLVWVSVMQLYEEGKIDLDEDIRVYLPDEFLKKIRYKDEKITLKNLMSHNAGFQESFYENQLATEEQLYSNLEEAVISCEPYQAYHVGEFTAYSNWGTALAALIVENVSNEDYISYVNNHIFKPLNMSHTSIDPKLLDNDYVKDKRNDLHCYYRGKKIEDNQNLGTARSYVQLYPAGACVGTLHYFATFGQAFVSKENPLFKKEETRREMFEPTSHYTDSNISKNCHGLWTLEYGVQVLGHAGNTMGCSSNLVFDPKSNTGIVIMTNEPGETIFNYGLPKVLYGSIKDRKGIDTSDISSDDISGFYIQKRNISEGLGKFQQYFGGILPIRKAARDKYSLNLFGFSIGDTNIFKIGKNSYLMDNGNGLEMYMHKSKTKANENRLEMMSTDYVAHKSNKLMFLFLCIAILLGIISLIILVGKFIILIFKNIKNKTVNFNKNIALTQVLWATITVGIVFYLASDMVFTPKNAVISGIVITVMGLVSSINGLKLFMISSNGKSGKERIYLLFWGFISFVFTIFVILFKFYNFWNI